MRTNGHHRSNRSPRGDTRRLCGYCGVEWYRSELVRDASHNLAGPCCQAGRDIVTLAVGNAEMASQKRIGEPHMASDGSIDSTPNEIAPPLNWNGPPVARQNQGPTGPLSVIVELWLRGDSVVSAGGIVDRWLDLSGRSNHCFPVSAASAPSVAVDVDGLPMAVFDGVTNRLVSSNQCAPRPVWIWAIAKPISGISNGGIVRSTVGFYIVTPDLRTVGTSFGATVGVVFGDWIRVSLTGDLADATNVLVVRSASNGSAGIGTLTGRNTVIGAGSAAGVQPANFALKELLLTAGVPTAAEIAAIEDYGAARYGVGYFL